MYLGLSSAVLEELLAGSFSLELGFEAPEYARGSLTLDSFYQEFGRREIIHLGREECMSGEIMILIAIFRYVLTMYQAYVKSIHTSPLWSGRHHKWLQIRESQISEFPKKSGVGVSWQGKLSCSLPSLLG